jgi:hypothetical protein
MKHILSLRKNFPEVIKNMYAHLEQAKILAWHSLRKLLPDDIDHICTACLFICLDF